MEASQYVRLSSLLPQDLAVVAGERWWRLPPFVFKPGAWTHVFLRGLKRLSLSPGQRVWEVGVGSGVVPDFLVKQFPGITVLYSDQDERMVVLAGENLMVDSQLPSWFIPLEGRWNLLKQHGTKTPKVDYIVACIPQVPLPPDKVLSDKDFEAHYYVPNHRPQCKYNAVGLGLTEALLLEAKETNPSAGVVLNLAGRPTNKLLQEMFESCGYAWCFLYDEIIEQDPTTDLTPLVVLEKAGAKFEFFADPNGSCKISAATAEAMRHALKPVYHSLNVIEGRKA